MLQPIPPPRLPSAGGSRFFKTLSDEPDWKSLYREAAANAANERRSLERKVGDEVHKARRQHATSIIPHLEDLRKLRFMAHDGYEIRETDIEALLTSLESRLAEGGVQRMTVNVGDRFDPLYHEAISISEGRNGRLLIESVLFEGYLIDGEVLK